MAEPKMPKAVKKLYRIARPIAGRISYAGTMGQPLWGVSGGPMAPQMPQTHGLYTGVPPYGIPSPQLMMPTQAWWQSLSPGVKHGLYAPYREAALQLGEQFGARGQLGSARGGYSGAYGAAMGELAARAAEQVPLQAWQMTAPGAMQGWQAHLQRGQMGYQQALRERELGYQQDIWRRQQDYSMLQEMWNRQQQAIAAPYSLMPGYIGSMGQLPQYATPQRPSPWGAALGGAATGAMAGGMYGGGYGAAIGAVGGGLMGYGTAAGWW